MAREVPESPARRAGRIARVGARYGFGFVLGRRFFRGWRAEPERVGPRLRLSFEELGPTFAELGRFLSARGDLLPPRISTELARCSAGVKPSPPAEVRAIVERSLHNTLERLFVDFEEAPARTGVFTQSHRATLPGERPALVVVIRPNVRRDLLAMRPVADLTRRRLGDRLPLDPVEAATEFAAHAAHRRDMHFAAQISRQIKAVEDFELRIPDIYRDYSGARCITFEAPAQASPPGAGELRGISSELVRLALTEGIFLSEPVPERFAVSDGEVWLADPTEAFAVDEERMRGVAEILAAMRREDVEGIIRNLALVGGVVPDDDTALRRELRETLGSLGGPLWREHSLEQMISRGLEAMRRGGSRLSVEAALLAHSLAETEKLAEGYSGTEAAAGAAEETISRFRDPRRVASRVARKLARPEVYADYPRQVHALLEELRDGEVEVSFRHAGLDELISKVDILANRLVFAFLIAALILGSTVLAVFSTGGAQLFGVNIFGLIGFLFAAVLGLALLVGIIRSGRL